MGKQPDGKWTMVFPHVALMQTNISRKRNKVTIHQLGESIKRDFKFKKKARRGERRRPPCTDKLSITRGSSEEQIRQPCQFPGEQMGSIRHPCPRASSPPTPNTRTPFNMWTGLTSNISPRRNTIATQETISAWFWMTNSWLSTGGFLVVFFRIPISARFGPTFFFIASRSADVVAFCRILLLSWSARTLKAPSCFLRAKGQAAIEWRVTLLLVGGVRGERAAAPDQRRALRTGEKQLGLSIATCRSGVRL